MQYLSWRSGCKPKVCMQRAFPFLWCPSLYCVEVQVKLSRDSSTTDTDNPTAPKSNDSFTELFSLWDLSIKTTSNIYTIIFTSVKWHKGEAKVNYRYLWCSSSIQDHLIDSTPTHTHLMKHKHTYGYTHYHTTWQAHNSCIFRVDTIVNTNSIVRTLQQTGLGSCACHIIQ